MFFEGFYTFGSHDILWVMHSPIQLYIVKNGFLYVCLNPLEFHDSDNSCNSYKYFTQTQQDDSLIYRNTNQDGTHPPQL